MAMMQVETTAEVAGKVYHFKAKHPAGIVSLEFEDQPDGKIKLIFEIGIPDEVQAKSLFTYLTIDCDSGLVVDSKFHSVVRQLGNGKTYEISYDGSKFALREK